MGPPGARPSAPPYLRELYEQALLQWVPAWAHRFVDAQHGGFYERLDATGRPCPQVPKRLLTQCRQLFVYSRAQQLVGDARYTGVLRAGLDFMRRAYHRPASGLWAFSVEPHGHPHDAQHDLYAHAFVVLALSFYLRATQDAHAHPLLETTLSALDMHFRAEAGFYERLSADGTPQPGLRRQNSHMHLLEACLMADALVKLPGARRVAADVVDLFLQHFYDPHTATLVEYFDHDWRPHPEFGDSVEPGHHYEWVWLLHRWLQQCSDVPTSKRRRIQAAATALKAWADTHARDTRRGGIFDELRRSDACVLKDTRRIWHVTESLKASVLIPGGRYTTAADAALLRDYVRPDGLWVETLTRRDEPDGPWMPGTTPYHILMGITEAYQLAESSTGLPAAAGSNSASPW